MSKPNNNRPKPKAKQPIDPLLAQRLEQLNTRRPAGAPLPPPAPGTAAGDQGSSARAQSGQATAARPAAMPAGATPEQAAKLAAAAERAAAARAAKQGGARPGAAVPPSRRNKPAAASKVASVAISAATTLALAGMFARQDGQSSDSVILTAGTDPAGATAAPAATTATTVAAPTTTAAAPAAGTDATTVTTAAAPVTTAAAVPATIADGTYLGGASQNRWGVVQVQAVYSGGQLTDVQILSYPDGDRKSININQRALPTLIDEAISAQNADISGVSGATYTSRSYVASLQSAIDNAKQASGIS
ncbi:MAG: FMN-binding protein [Ilumatobacteraceae bacterium]